MIFEKFLEQSILNVKLISIEQFETVLGKETRASRNTTVRWFVIGDRRVVYRVSCFAGILVSTLSVTSGRMRFLAHSAAENFSFRKGSLGELCSDLRSSKRARGSQAERVE